MPFPQLQVTCASAAANPQRGADLPIMGDIHWNEAPALGLRSTNKTPESKDGGTIVVEILALVDSYVAFHPSDPQPGNPNSARYPVQANVPANLRVKPGQFFAWISA